MQKSPYWFGIDQWMISHDTKERRVSSSLPGASHPPSGHGKDMCHHSRFTRGGLAPKSHATHSGVPRSVMGTHRAHPRLPGSAAGPSHCPRDLLFCLSLRTLPETQGSPAPNRTLHALGVYGEESPHPSRGLGATAREGQEEGVFGGWGHWVHGGVILMKRNSKAGAVPCGRGLLTDHAQTLLASSALSCILHVHPDVPSDKPARPDGAGTALGLLQVTGAPGWGWGSRLGSVPLRAATATLMSDPSVFTELRMLAFGLTVLRPGCLGLPHQRSVVHCPGGQLPRPIQSGLPPSPFLLGLAPSRALGPAVCP